MLDAVARLGIDERRLISLFVHSHFRSMTYFINRQAGRYHETIDEFETRDEAEKMKNEYQFSEHGRAYYYVSKVARPNYR